MQSKLTPHMAYIWILLLSNISLGNGDLIPIDVPQDICEQIRELVIPRVPAPLPHQVVGGGNIGLVLAVTLQVQQGGGETQFETHVNTQPPIQKPQLPDQTLTQILLAVMPTLQQSGLLQGAAKVIITLYLMTVIIPIPK